MRDICFHKSANTAKPLVMHCVGSDDSCKVKTVYRILIFFQSLGTVLFWSPCISEDSAQWWVHVNTAMNIRVTQTPGISCTPSNY
jgi:hypothetical protein